MFFVILFFFSGQPASAQNTRRADSLQTLLASSSTDTTRIRLLNLLSEEVVDVNPERAIQAAQQALLLSTKTNNREGEAMALRNVGYGYYNQASYKTALTQFLKALHIQESLKNKKGILASATAIGNLYLELRQPDEALPYFRRTLDLANELNLKRGKATSYIGLGTVFSNKGDNKQGLAYYTDALRLFQELNEKSAIATSYNNIANIYDKEKNYAKALVYITKALAINEEIGNIYGVSLALNNIAFFYNAMGNYDKAIEFYKQGLEKAQKMGANDRILESCKGLASAYKKQGNYKEALRVSEMSLRLDDTVYNRESTRQMAEMQARFDNEKKEQQIGLLTRDKRIREAELGRQTLINWVLALGVSLLLLLAMVAVFGYVQKKKGNDLLAMKNNKIETAYNIIEEQHKDIKDSIRYAKRIQEAILPATRFKDSFGENGFVLFKPKDIVSGDFFWVEKTKSGETLVAAVDCTGHGVPGAFMSIVGNNLLNQAVKERGHTDPSEILNELNQSLSDTLMQTMDDSSVKDGMDIALCSIRPSGKGTWDLCFAGANNPVWLIRKPQRGMSPVLEEIKGDKFPIGIFVGEEMHCFGKHEIKLQEGDTLYIFTDGFADQFGGAKGKKFKYRTLKDLLLVSQHISMVEQKAMLENTLARWKGELEQVDDILVIGIRIG
ncbi:MAG TPA: tetratricopeptide repeat protein [Bacteroidia bacterium]|nr:tetratricopeptide repeat protein [Bacteroidia bacterium]